MNVKNLIKENIENNYDFTVKFEGDKFSVLTNNDEIIFEDLHTNYIGHFNEQYNLLKKIKPFFTFNKEIINLENCEILHNFDCKLGCKCERITSYFNDAALSKIEALDPLKKVVVVFKEGSNVWISLVPIEKIFKIKYKISSFVSEIEVRKYISYSDINLFIRILREIKY